MNTPRRNAKELYNDMDDLMAEAAFAANFEERNFAMAKLDQYITDNIFNIMAALKETINESVKFRIRKKPFDSYRDGGTKIFTVLNDAEVDRIYQDFRISSETKGRYFTDYPGTPNAKEISESDIEFVD